MNIETIAIICDGRELSYGASLSHLFRYVSENQLICSSAAGRIRTELFSKKAFTRASIPSSTIKIYYGNAANLNISGATILNQFGMKITQAESCLSINSDPRLLDQNTYTSFLEYANSKREGYIGYEKEYVNKVLEIEPTWIPTEFVYIKKSGIFSYEKYSRMIQQQQFDCLAFVLYFYLTCGRTDLEVGCFGKPSINSI